MPLQPIEQSLTAQAWGDPWQALPLQSQNRHFKVITSSQFRLNPLCINIDHLQAQRWFEATEIYALKPLLQAFTKAAALPAEQGQLHGLNQERGHNRRG